MPALHRTVPLAEVDRAAVRVREDLDLDVTHARQIPLDIDLGVPEGGLGFGRGRGQRRRQFRLFTDDTHAASAPAERGLQQDRVADLGRDPGGFLHAGHPGFGPRKDRHPGPLHDASRERLVPHAPNTLRGRADERDAAGLADLGERVALRKESVAGMDGVGAGDLRRGQDARDVEVALPRGGRPDADPLVGEPYRQGVAIRIGIGDHGPQAEVPAGRDDPHRDFAAVGDQDLVEHVRL